MKALVYAVRPDEIDFFEQFSKELNLDIDLCSSNLTEDTVEQAKGYQTVIFLAECKVTGKVLESLKSFGINHIVSRSVGVDNVDWEKANELDIKIANVPAYSPNSVSEFVLTSTLVLLRNYHHYLDRVQNQDFTITGLVAKEIRNQVVAIIGVGKIGFETVKNFTGFGPKEILLYDPFEKEEVKKYGRYTSLEEIYKSSDIIVYHIPLLKDTVNIISKKNIDKMKKGVILINVSRGGIMNASDLLDGINEGKIAGAAVDVYDNELSYFRHDWREKNIPDTTLVKLLAHPQVIVTPHAAFYTDEAVSNMVSISLGNVKEFFDTGNSKNIVNKK